MLLSPLLQHIDDMFDSVAHQTPLAAMDLDETDDAFVISLDIPGVPREELNIEVLGNRLHIFGERKGMRKSTRFQKSFMLPEGTQADAVSAELKDGVLNLAIQKPAAVKSTKIRIGEAPVKASFLKNLIGEKKTSKDSVEIKREPVAVGT